MSNSFVICSVTFYDVNIQILNMWAVSRNFQQCGILTSVDSDQSVQHPFKVWNSINVQPVAEHS